MYLHRARPFLTIYRPRRFAVHGGHPLAKRDPAGPGVVATILFLCLFAAQSGAVGADAGARRCRARVRSLDGRGGTDPHRGGRCCGCGRARGRRGHGSRPAADGAVGWYRSARRRRCDELRCAVGVRAHCRAGADGRRLFDPRRGRRRGGGGLERRRGSWPSRGLDARGSADSVGSGNAGDRRGGSDELAARVRGAHRHGRGCGSCAATRSGRAATSFGARPPNGARRPSSARLGDQRGVCVCGVEWSACLLWGAVRRVVRLVPCGCRRLVGARSRCLHPGNVRCATDRPHTRPAAARGHGLATRCVRCRVRRRSGGPRPVGDRLRRPLLPRRGPHISG